MLCCRSFLLLFLPLAALAGPRWIQVTTPNFELYTSASEKKARKTIVHFERLNAFFLQNMGLQLKGKDRVCIIAFRNLNESRDYRMGDRLSAYFMRTYDREFIILSGLQGEDDPTAVHEFVHLLVSRTNLKLPIWLNEGQAEFYSTVRPTKNKVIFGELPEGRLQGLLQNGFVNLEQLVANSDQSDFYHGGNLTSTYYLQSWLLTHMLMLSPQYRAGFPNFVVAHHEGQTSMQAFESVYRMSVDVVEGDLRAYARGAIYKGTLDAPMEHADVEPEVRAPDEVQIESLLIQLLAQGKRHPAKTEDRLASLRSLHPDDPRSHATEGLVRMAGKDYQRAAESFRRAADLGSADPTMYLNYATSLQLSGGEIEDVTEALEGAVMLRPARSDGQLRLGLALTSQQRYSEALEHLAKVTQITVEQAVPFYQAVALGQHDAGELEHAKRSAQLAIEAATTPALKASSETILGYVSQPKSQLARATVPRASALAPPEPIESETEEIERPTLRRGPAPPPDVRSPPGAASETISGELLELQCAGASARIKVRVDEQVHVLRIGGARDVVVSGSQGANSGVVDLECGPLDAHPVTVTYDPSAADADAAGLVHAIHFR